MSLFCFASAKGAPGVTTTALGVAAALPTGDSRCKVLVEADPSGGSLAIVHRVSRQPGLISLTASARHGLSRDDLWSHAQELGGGLPVVVAPERGDRASAVLSDGAAALGPWLAQRHDVTAIADCGRINSEQVSSGLIAHANHVFFVIRPTAEQLQPALALVDQLQEAGKTVEWVVIGSKPYTPEDIARTTWSELAAVLPDDHRTARAIAQGQVGSRERRSPLARSIGALAMRIDDIAAQLSHPVEVPV